MTGDPFNAVITWVDPPEIPVEGPLAGRRLLVKDLIDTEGVRTTYGSRIFASTSRRAARPRSSGCSRPAPR